MQLNVMQIFLIIGAVCSALGGAAAQLTDIFGPTAAKDIVSVAALVSLLLNSFLIPMTGQKAQVQNVAAMQGVEKITVNAQANPTLARVAVDPEQMKVEATPGAVQTIVATAKG